MTREKYSWADTYVFSIFILPNFYSDDDVHRRMEHFPYGLEGRPPDSDRPPGFRGGQPVKPGCKSTHRLPIAPTGGTSSNLGLVFQIRARIPNSGGLNHFP